MMDYYRFLYGIDPGSNQELKQTFGDVGPWPTRLQGQFWDYREAGPKGVDFISGSGTGGMLAGMFPAAGIVKPLKEFPEIARNIIKKAQIRPRIDYSKGINYSKDIKGKSPYFSYRAQLSDLDALFNELLNVRGSLQEQQGNIQLLHGTPKYKTMNVLDPVIFGNRNVRSGPGLYMTNDPKVARSFGDRLFLNDVPLDLLDVAPDLSFLKGIMQETRAQRRQSLNTLNDLFSSRGKVGWIEPFSGYRKQSIQNPVEAIIYNKDLIREATPINRPDLRTIKMIDEIGGFGGYEGRLGRNDRQYLGQSILDLLKIDK